MKKMILGAVVLLLVLLVSVMFYRNRKKKEAEKAALALQYKEGMKEIFDKDNFFCADAQYLYWDSLMKSSAPPETRLVAQRFVSVMLLRTGQEKKAIDLLQDLVEKTKNDSYSSS